MDRHEVYAEAFAPDGGPRLAGPVAGLVADMEDVARLARKVGQPLEASGGAVVRVRDGDGADVGEIAFPSRS